MPKVTLEYKRKVKKSIIDAAIRLFAKYGYEKTTTDDLAEAASVSVGTLYLYFSSKEELFRSICIELDSTLVQENKIIFSNPEKLELGHFYDRLAKNNKFFDSILLDAINESKNNAKLRKIWLKERNNAVNIIKETLRETKKAGVFLQNCKDITSISSGFIALYYGLAMARHANEDYELNKKAFVKSVSAMFTS